MIRRFAALEPLDRAVLCRVALALFVLRLSRRRRAGEARHRLGQGPTMLGRGGAAPDDLVRRVRWAVSAVGRRVPGLANCLIRALAADRVLRRYGRTPTLRVGVARDDDFVAHAWLECDGEVVVGGGDFDAYEVLHARRATW